VEKICRRQRQRGRLLSENVAEDSKSSGLSIRDPSEFLANSATSENVRRMRRMGEVFLPATIVSESLPPPTEVDVAEDAKSSGLSLREPSEFLANSATLENVRRMREAPRGGHSYLRRLPAEAYQGYAVVHWSMSMDRRKTGSLSDLFHYRFREILAHAAHRYHLICPAYVLMPDHWHLILMGVEESTDQRVATRFFRKQLNWILRPEGFELQKQAHDHVLRENSRTQNVFETVVGYVRENPLRAALIEAPEDLSDYPFAGCLVPGYPELDIWNADFWESLWKLYWLARKST
jgi:putative transposase